MLLLVLILVLIAFGLLVVALLTGNVLCAWLSVAVSVAAAVVLVVDWLQRRSAVNAGRAGAETAPHASADAPLADLDPVTEVLPVVSSGADASASTAETRFDAVADGQQTVVMPAVQPSGSTARPSGAEGSSTPSGGSSSPSVTSSPPESSAGDGGRARADEPDADRSTPQGDAESTVVVDIRKAGIDAGKGDAARTTAPAGNDRQAAPRLDKTDKDPASGTATLAHGTSGLLGSTPATQGRSGPDAAATRDEPPVSRLGGTPSEAVTAGASADTQAVDIRKAADVPGRAAGPSGDGKVTDGRPADRFGKEGRSADGQSVDRRDGEGHPIEGRVPLGRGAEGQSPLGGSVAQAGATPTTAAPETGFGAPTSGGSGPGGTGAQATDRPDTGQPSAAGGPGGPGSTPLGSAPANSAPPGSTPSAATSSSPARLGAALSGAALSGSAPSGSAPSGSAPSGSAPSGSAAAGSTPAASTPAGSAAAGSAAPGSTPAGSTPSASTPAGSTPAGSTPPGSTPPGSTRPGWPPSAATPPGSTPPPEPSSPAADVGASSSPAGNAPGAPPPSLRTDERARATFGGPVSGSAHELFDPVERSEGATTPPPSDGAEATTTMRAAGAGGPHQFDDDEPPEEPLDPAVSRVVATLDVEVVVVDEQPRYHVAGCQALVAQTLIPLPVREAVELGFTPCGWCTPDAVLGARHRTSVRP